MNGNRRVFFPAIAALSALVVGCASGSVRHGWIMRGQVLAVENDVAAVCVGTRDGAQVGQVLDVQRITMTPAPPKGAGPTFARSTIGQVKIIDLFDDHYAHAKILTGSPLINDVVELQLK
jgi:hypothetical protein